MKNDIKDNLSVKERDALKTWRKDNLFNEDSKSVMRLQDKGNRFIIVDKDTDKAKAKEQISRSSFIHLDEDPTESHIAKVREWANKWFSKGEISKQWKDYIINEKAKPGKNATLYKTHKQNNPVRLLTTGCNTAIENLSRFIEKLCAPLVVTIPTRIKDTSHLLEIIDQLNTSNLPENTTLVSFDIINMFPSIDNTKGMAAVKEALNSRNTKMPSTECILEGLHICLFNNNSMFDKDHLIQTNGTATGAPNSCSYSDLAIYPLDRAVLNEKQNNFIELSFFGRYRDDCFVVWNGTVERLNDFFTFLNSLDSDLQFTMEIGNKNLCFLDLKISVEDGKLFTTVYSKPTDSHLYLDFNSCHKKASMVGIEKGVALRLRRICSTDNEYNERSKEYKAYLCARGHPAVSVNSSFDKISKVSKSQARKKKHTSNNTTNKIIFSAEYNPRGPSVSDIVKKHEHLLRNDDVLNNLFPPSSILVANKRCNNLQELLSRADPYNIKSDLTDNSYHGYKKCDSRRCDSCNHFVVETNEIKCFATGRKFKIRRDSSCSSNNVIYMAYCKKCQKQGVNSTIKWKPRLANYKSHIKKGIPSCEIVKHFLNDCKDSEEPSKNLGFIIIDVLNNTENLSLSEIDDLLLEKERFWIGTLVSQHKGLNGSHDWVRAKRSERKKD